MPKTFLLDARWFWQLQYSVVTAVIGFTLMTLNCVPWEPLYRGSNPPTHALALWNNDARLHDLLSLHPFSLETSLPSSTESLSCSLTLLFYNFRINSSWHNCFWGTKNNFSGTLLCLCFQINLHSYLWSLWGVRSYSQDIFPGIPMQSARFIINGTNLFNNYNCFQS